MYYTTTIVSVGILFSPYDQIKAMIRIRIKRSDPSKKKKDQVHWYMVSEII